MGVLDRANYRSAELYLDAAKQTHIELGFTWSQQLALAARQARRACRRGRGPAKQAQPLPMTKLALLPHYEQPVSDDAPCFPVRSTLIASWWLLREIEASNARVQHIKLDLRGRLVHWRLPSSKTDIEALGAIRTHACSCPDDQIDNLCPFHLMEAQLRFCKLLNTETFFPTAHGSQPAKSGWAATFESLATQLDEPLQTPSGAKRFTGHTARATGAVHLAQTQVELWRIQLFGRWGSECFKIYVRAAPLSQLTHLAQETAVNTSLATARAELQSLLQAIKSLEKDVATTSLKQQSVEVLADCEAANTLMQPPPVDQTPTFVLNTAPSGKLHRVMPFDRDTPHYLWHTKCSWYFARHQIDYSLVTEIPPGYPKCMKCFRSLKAQQSSETSSSNSSSSES